MATISQKADYVRRQPGDGNHHCHWTGCETLVPPAMWGCKRHWFKLPTHLRNKIWATYRPGQEISKTPSREYVEAAREVQDWIAGQEMPQQRIVGSYTFFNELDNCPFKAYQVRIVRSVPYVSSPEAEWGNKVHDAMEKRVGDGTPLAGDLARFEPFALCFDGKQVKTELKLGIQPTGAPTKFFGDNCYVAGKIDVTWAISLTHIDITDWKTGKEDYETPFELELHALLHNAAAGSINTRYTARYAYIGRAKRPDKIGKTYDTADGTLATPQQTWAKVNGLMARAYDFAKKGYWPKTPNPLCGWCNVVSCEHNKSEARKLKEGAKP